ncbi:MAG: glycosyltransferase family 4 protein [Phycisphaerales bacterium]|nr:glycosyltransferase family 4 protein [Phycisphaerales bacterium]
MKILYIHQHFITNEGTGGTRSFDVSKYLLAAGHEVTMVCGIYWQGSFPRMPWWRLWRTEWIDGIKVKICNSYYANEQRPPMRMWRFFKFAMIAFLATLFERGIDIIFATSTPLTVGIPARLASACKRVPYVFEVRDLWPEDLLAAGRLKPGLMYRCWEWLEAFSYKRAKRILLVSKGFHDRLLERGFAPPQLKTVLLGADGGLFKSLTPDVDYIRRNGLEGKTIAVYTGSYGNANGLFQVLDAAEHLRDRDDIALVMIGDGKEREELTAIKTEKKLDNVHLLPFVQKFELPNILAACHIGLMILKQITRPRWVTPNKLFDYMFAGLPTIVNFPGTTAELVETEGVGVASEPGDAADLAAKIRYYADHPEERKRVGAHARETAFAKFDRKQIADDLIEVFDAVLAETRGTTNTNASPVTANKRSH